VTDQHITIDLIFSERSVCLDFLVVMSSRMKIGTDRITSRGLLSLVMTKKKLHQIAKSQGFTLHQIILKRIYEITTTAPESTLEQSHAKMEDL
jgi:hypothetical protein